MTDFCVYIHRRKHDGTVFYVGKGHDSRPYSRFGRNKWWHRIVEKYGFTVEIVIDGLQEWAAFEIEKDLISYYGRKDLGYGELCNLSDGGEGISGYVHTAANRERQSEKMKGLTNNKTDWTVYTFVNIHTKEEFIGTRHNHPELSSKTLSCLFGKRACLSINGWCLKENLNKISVFDLTSYKFMHKNGEIFQGTRSQFTWKYGFSVCELFRENNKAKSVAGWSLPHNFGASDGRDHNTYLFANDFGDLLLCTRNKFKNIVGVSAKSLFTKGRRDTKSKVRGWWRVRKQEDRELTLYIIKNFETSETFEGLRAEFESTHPNIPTRLFSKNSHHAVHGWKVIEKRKYSIYSPNTTCNSVISMV